MRSVLCAALALLFGAGLLANAAPAKHESRPWWKGAVFYEIYPRSFQDSNSDGIGDLNGITARLEYIKSLGVDAIWLAPVYPSPQVDFGYDISNYKDIYNQYGTLKDFDRLVAKANKLGIRVIMDLVLNHSSDKHPWFIESASSRDNPKRDWYIWRDGKGPGKPPNNWGMMGRAWQYDAKTGQYYYHRYGVHQPDLNWRNPEVAKAMYDVTRFWIERGVSGFRLDAITTLFEDVELRDEDVVRDADGKPVIGPFGVPHPDSSRTDNLPEVHDVLRELRRVTDSYPDREVILIGETIVHSIADLRKMYGENNDELHLPMDLEVGFVKKFEADLFRQRLVDVQTKLGGNEPLLVLDNHDRPRWDRYADGVHDQDIGRVLATVIIASRGAAMYYYGDEIGMVTTPPERFEDARDVYDAKFWPMFKGRDGERTPMQWTDGPNAGFSPAGVITWLPIPPSYKTANVAVQSRDPHSILAWYRLLGRLKHSSAALHEGEEILLNPADPNVLSWLRKTEKEAVLVACNFTAAEQTVSFDLKDQGISGKRIKTLMKSPSASLPASLSKITLPPYGVYVLQVK